MGYGHDDDWRAMDDDEDIPSLNVDSLKWDWEGISSLEELATAMEERAAYWRRVAAAGFVLDGAVENAWLKVSHPEGRALLRVEGDVIVENF